MYYIYEGITPVTGNTGVVRGSSYAVETETSRARAALAGTSGTREVDRGVLGLQQL